MTIKKLVLVFAAVTGLSLTAIAGTPESKAESPAKSETKTQALLYWFDANTGQYIGRSEASGCNHLDPEPCANGYTSVANPTNPVEPSSTPNQVETGKR